MDSPALVDSPSPMDSPSPADMPIVTLGERPSAFSRSRLAGRAAAVAALVFGVALASLLLRSGHGSRPSSSQAPRQFAVVSPVKGPQTSTQKPDGPIVLARASSPPAARRPDRRRPAEKLAAVSAPTEDAARKPAEGFRLIAALARIEAERLDADQLAGQLLSEGKSREREGERLLTERDWAGARAAFERAAGLFREAESAAREERVRRVQLLPAD
jgi:hypothetical protein